MTDTVVDQPAAVLHSIEAGVLTITINRPEAGNALRPEDRNTLIRLFSEADGDREVRVVVLRANGRLFCAGADVVRLAAGHAVNVKRATDPMRTIMHGAQQLIASILDCSKPVVAVVQGGAAGIGAHLAYSADLVVAAEESYFAEAFVKRGLVMDGGVAYLLARRIGMQAAKEMAFFGEKLPASEALRLGLVNRVVPADQVDAVADDFVRRLSTAPTTAIGLTKRLLNDAPDTDRTGSFVAEAMAQEIQSYSDDAKEGVRAFVEKRPAEFVGW